LFSLTSPHLAQRTAVQVAINARVVVPMALEAGARSIRDDDKADSSAVGFAKDGGGNSTKTLHRTVVVFVVAMLVGTVGHLHAIIFEHTTMHDSVSGSHTQHDVPAAFAGPDSVLHI
jgi:hypothetical protein